MTSTSVTTNTFLLLIFLTLPGYCTCVTDLYADSGSFTSPNYPSNYPSSIERSWIVHAAPGKSITLTFQTFDLEGGSGCSYDYVEVRENNAWGTSRTGKLCGTGISRTVRSSTSLYIVFHTDSSRQYSGFRVQYVQSAGSTSQYCSFTHGYSSKYCSYGCCYSTYDCCTHSYSSSSSGSSWSSSSGSSWSSWSGSSYNDNGSNTVKAWVITVIVVGSLGGMGAVIFIIVCFVKSVKRSTTTTTVHPVPAVQPTVMVISTAVSSTMTSNGQWAQPAYGPTPGGVYGPPVPGIGAPPNTNPPLATGLSYPQPQTGDNTSPL